VRAGELIDTLDPDESRIAVEHDRPEAEGH
jgi:hypothetical protein